MERFFGLIGRKLAHSYSVPIHKAMGNESYRLFELEPNELEAFVKNPNLGGINITIPYKIPVMDFCDIISDEAQNIGAVNTIIRRNGKIYGYNTDKYGFEYMLQKADIDLFGKKVLVLGSGGAAKTACYCANALGAKEVVIISRSGENNYSNLSKHYDADIIINATPVGMYPDNASSPISLENFKNCTGVADIVYNPLKTALLLQAKSLNIKCTGGLSMLTAQAKAAEELFFDTVLSDSICDSVTSQLYKDSLNIVLIGMPGSGKSTIGKILSSLTGREAIETDELIVKKAEKTIPEIFKQDGEAVFRRIESEVIAEEAKKSGKIIITGGGAVTVDANYIPLAQNGIIYEIQRDINTLATNGRPLSKDISTLTQMYEKRKCMYEKFRDSFVINNGSLSDAANLIWSDFNENTYN